MLNVTPIRGNNQYAAARYFSAADDYYAKETPGEWQGEGAERLGLVGPVDQLQLAKLLDGVWGAMEPKTNVSPTSAVPCLLPRHPLR